MSSRALPASPPQAAESSVQPQTALPSAQTAPASAPALPAAHPSQPVKAPATVSAAHALHQASLAGPPPTAPPRAPATAYNPPALPPTARPTNHAPPSTPIPGPPPGALPEPGPTALSGPLPPALPGPPPKPAAAFSLPGPPARPPGRPTNPKQRPTLPPPPPPRFDPNDPQLNFFSKHFDALKALNTPGLQPPVPRVKALDNVVKCRRILPPELPESYAAWHAAHPKAEPTEESIKQKVLSKHRTAAVLKREQDQAAKGNTLDKITEKFKEGPLLLLRRYYKTSVRLQVVTRHASGVRGTATGYLHGFDKFMNLVLMNVDENYTVMVREPHPYTVTVYEPAEPKPPATYAVEYITGQQDLQLAMVQKQINKFRWKRKAEKRTRRLHQVFLRGDNIVTVTPVLRDVERNWTQLLPQWREAAFPEAALVTPASLAAAAAALPPPPPLPAQFPPAAAQMLPSWTTIRR